MYLPFKCEFIYGGTREVYKFNNGYGASVVRHEHSYGFDRGLYELAVLKFSSLGDHQGGITYETPITSDVIGYLTPDEVEDLLQEIEALPAHRKEGMKHNPLRKTPAAQA